MKKLNYLLMLFLLGIVITSCQRDELIELIPDKEYHKNDREINQINLRSFNQVDCGFNDAFCEKRNNRFLAHHEPAGPCQWPCFTGGGSDESSSSKIILPVEIFDGTTAVYYDDGVEKYFIINSVHRAFVGKTVERKVSNDILQLLTINYRDITDGAKVLEDVQSSNLVSLTTLDDGKFRINTNNEGGTTSAMIRYCDYYRTSDVDLFITTFFDENVDFGEVVDLISEAYDAASNDSECSISGYTGTSYSKCRYNCIDPRCIVDHILNSFTDDNTKKAIQARYLSTVLNLTIEEAFWLENEANKETVSLIYNGLNQDLNLNICENEDCGLAGGYHEFIKQSMAGQTLTTDETKSLLEFFSVMRCDDPEIYGCFREAQQNPDGDVATILNEIKEAIITDNIALLDGCDDLSDYTDTWYELSTLNPNNIQLVSDKLEQLGDDYWIQTLENADTGVPVPSYPYPRWWDYNPSVNMDFFGVTIEVLPNNPNTGLQFTPEEFFNYIQLNFSPDFMGEDNECGPYFEFINSTEQTNWTDGNAVSTVFTIHMADDGNVIASEHVSGEYWTFSTLNAPGWLEGDSWDGFHPVSGNRRFGLLQNSDGTYTFYTSGVDRLTGWWHVLADASPFVDAFGDADELWACVMGIIADFVNQNGGTTSSNFNCTTVRPKWSELRDAIKKGCDGLIESIEDFPCEQAEPCQ